MNSKSYPLLNLVDKLNTKKIIFCGSDEIALPMLEQLSRDSMISICGILSQPDRRSGRGRKLKANPIKDWALHEGLEVRTPERPTQNEIEWLREVAADLVLVMAYGHILSQEFLNCAPLGCYNLHASLLPKYRGASPIETALANGEKETGVTLMRMVRKMDAGPIVGQEIVPIQNEDTGITLRSKLAESCVPLISNYMENLLTGDASETPQIEREVTYCRKLNKDDAQMDFSFTASQLECRVRAFQPWPGSMFVYDGIPLKIGSCKALPDYELSTGRIEAKHTELIIGTGVGSLKIFELQKPGGKMLPIADFLRGFHMENHGKVKFAQGLPLISKKFH